MGSLFRGDDDVHPCDDGGEDWGESIPRTAEQADAEVLYCALLELAREEHAAWLAAGGGGASCRLDLPKSFWGLHDPFRPFDGAGIEKAMEFEPALVASIARAKAYGAFVARRAAAVRDLKTRRSSAKNLSSFDWNYSRLATAADDAELDRFISGIRAALGEL